MTARPSLAVLGPSPAAPDRLLTAEQVAGILGVRPKRVYELGIPYVQLSARSKRWRRSVVEQWIVEHERSA